MVRGDYKWQKILKNLGVWSSAQQKGHGAEDKWSVHSSVSTHWIAVEGGGGRENWVDW